MRLSRDLIIVISLFLVLIGFTVFNVARRSEIEEAQDTFVPYSTHSARTNGTLALQLWLQAMGYGTRRIEHEAFHVPDEARLLFIFPRFEEFEAREVQAVLRWVERGNALIVADTYVASSKPQKLMAALKAKVKILEQPIESAPLEQPLMGAAPVVSVTVQASRGLVLDRSEYVQYLSAQAVPLLVSWSQGKGKIFLTSAPYLFTNEGLHDEHNAALVRVLLSSAPVGSRVAFDEYHLGYTGNSERETIQWLLYNTHWGWAIIYSFVVVFAYLLVNGQRFGRVMPLPKEIARRSPAEYVLSMAQLFRRGGKRRMVLQHYHQQLKRSLGKPYRINANLPDEEFVAELARDRNDLDRASLLQTLSAFNQRHVSERALVKLADEAIKLRTRSSKGD